MIGCPAPAATVAPGGRPERRQVDELRAGPGDLAARLKAVEEVRRRTCSASGASCGRGSRCRTGRHATARHPAIWQQIKAPVLSACIGMTPAGLTVTMDDTEVLVVPRDRMSDLMVDMQEGMHPPQRERPIPDFRATHFTALKPH